MIHKQSVCVPKGYNFRWHSETTHSDFSQKNSQEFKNKK